MSDPSANSDLSLSLRETDRIRVLNLSEVAAHLRVEPWVVRLWVLKLPEISVDAIFDDCFSAADLAILRRIHELVYVQGLTVTQARHALQSQSSRLGPGTDRPSTASARAFLAPIIGAVLMALLAHLLSAPLPHP